MKAWLPIPWSRERYWDQLMLLPTWEDREHEALLLDGYQAQVFVHPGAHFLCEGKLIVYLYLPELVWGVAERCMRKHHPRVCYLPHHCLPTVSTPGQVHQNSVYWRKETAHVTWVFKWATWSRLALLVTSFLNCNKRVNQILPKILPAIKSYDSNAFTAWI